MEAPKNQLEVFSPLLLLEYIRLMTAAAFLAEEKPQNATFFMQEDDYKNMMKEPLQTALIGLQLNYEAATKELHVIPNEAFLQRYNNKIMREVALMYAANYGSRYQNFIQYKKQNA